MRRPAMVRIRRSTIVCALEPPRRVQQDLRRTGTQGRQAISSDDRCDASESASHRRQPFKKGSVPRRIGRTKGGLNSKLHAVCDGQGRPVIMLLSEGQMSDYKGAGPDDRCSNRPRSSCSLTRAMMPTGFAGLLANAASWPASHRSQTEKSRSNMTASSIVNGTRSRTCSAGSRTGDASTPDTTDAPIHSCLPSASQPPSSSGSNQ